MKRFFSLGIASVLMFALTMVGYTAQAAAATSGGVRVSFTFDDGPAGDLLAAQTLQTYGYAGTAYIITGCIGMTTTPNTCAANPDVPYMTWNEVATLHNTYGWEIGSHTQTHPLLGQDTAGVTPLTPAQLDSELSGSKTALAAQGYEASDFASPYGDYDNRAIAAIAKYYNSHRTFQDDEQPPAAELSNNFPYYSPRNTYPYNNYLLTTKAIQGNISVATAKTYVDQARANSQWLVLVFHSIVASGASTVLGDYQYNAADLGQIAAYVKSLNIPVTNVSSALASGTNIMLNSGFDDGIADGWTTDSATTIKADKQATAAAGHGSYDGSATGPLNSIAITGSATDTHLYSPIIGVDPTQTYTLTNFVNVTSTSGEIDFFVNEFNAAGAYVSGKYVQGVTGSATAGAVQVGNVNFLYTPSAGVAKAQVYAIVHGAGTRGYIDNMRWLSPTGVVVPVTPPPAGKPGDVNGDGLINIKDAVLVSQNWGKTGMTLAQGDLNGDGTVNIKDATLISVNWGK